MKKGEVSVKPLVYFISFILGLILVCIIGIKNTKALTISEYEVTWYYRNQSNESTLNNVLKDQSTPLWAGTNEYVNGFTTRAESTFTKDMQYIVSYNLFLQYSLSDDSNLRNDFLDRIENYCYADSDFKVLDCTATQVSKTCGEGCDLTINVTTQVKVINSTNAIRFGVYPSSNFSLGFYNHDSQVNYLLQNININENSSGAIIDQNNQIIDQNNKTNEELNNINGSINQSTEDLKESITESNKETQEVIKDQFNNCRDSYNLLNYKIASTLAGSKITINNNYINVNGNWGISFLNVNLPADTYSMSWDFDILSGSNDTNSWRIQYTDDSYSKYINNGSSFTAIKQIKNIYIYFDYGSNNFNINVSNVMLNKGSIVRPYEPYGEEICSNKIDETNDKLDNLTGAITDSTPPNTSGLENSAGWLPAGPLDSVLNLPLSLFNALTTNLNKSCNPINIPLPYVNKNITLPCINTLYNQIGITSFLSWIGVIVSGLMLYSYLLKLYKWIEDRISLNETHNVDSWGGL